MRGTFVTHSPTAQVFKKRVGVPQKEEEELESLSEEFLESQTVETLKAYVEERGIEVEGTGSGGNVIKKDLINALR